MREHPPPRHAVIETEFADLIDGPLAHILSGRFGAKSAGVLCAAIAHDLLRVAGVIRQPDPGQRLARWRSDLASAGHHNGAGARSR